MTSTIEKIEELTGIGENQKNYWKQLSNWLLLNFLF